jgi:hypothetical protein
LRFVTAAFAIFAVVTLTSAVAVVTLASAILIGFTASAAISAARMVPSKIFAVVTAPSTIATDPGINPVTAPDNATAAASLSPTNTCY